MKEKMEEKGLNFDDKPVSVENVDETIIITGAPNMREDCLPGYCYDIFCAMVCETLRYVTC